MKKIILGMLVLGSSIAGITQATVMNMEVGETYNYNGASITCDNNANCVSEFGDTILTGLIQGNSLQYQIIIRVGDDIAYFKDYGTYNFSRRIMEGCFTSLTNGVNANDYILNSIPNCTNSSGNFNTWIENASTYGGKLTSLTFNTFGNQGLICWNYDEELGSFCVQFANNQYNEAYDWGMVSPITVQKLIDIGMSESPFNGGGGNNGPTGYDPKTGLPCITLEQLYTTDATYNTGLCYTSNKIRTGTLTGGHFETVTPKNLNQIYPTYTQLRNDINTYYNYCTSPNTPERCMTAFSGNEDSYSIVSKLPNNIKPNILYDYCNTREIYSGNMNINICDLTTGNIADMVPSMLTPEGQAENLLNQGIGITQPGSGSVFDNYKGIKIRDTVEAMQSVYDKITGIFKNNTGVDGILPGYIVRIIIITLLFVLFKK